MNTFNSKKKKELGNHLQLVLRPVPFWRELQVPVVMDEAAGGKAGSDAAEHSSSRQVLAGGFELFDWQLDAWSACPCCRISIAAVNGHWRPC